MHHRLTGFPSTARHPDRHTNTLNIYVSLLLKNKKKNKISKAVVSQKKKKKIVRFCFQVFAVYQL
jgi:hypothetical protein